MLTYIGKGYSEAFIANYDAVVARLSDGEDILVVEGPDDICAPRLGDADAHCHAQSVLDRDRQAATDLPPFVGTSLNADSQLCLDPAVLMRMRHAFSQRVIRSACVGCEWTDLCDAVATDGYRATRLGSPSKR